MRIVTKITAGLLLLAAVGCREMPTVTVGGGRTLAKAGGATLDEQELGRALPAGLTGDDSVAFAELYVRKWIGKQLKLSEAEQLFSASADDIEAKVEAYRQSLLIRTTNASTRPSPRRTLRPTTTLTRRSSSSIGRWSRGVSCAFR